MCRTRRVPRDVSTACTLRFEKIVAVLSHSSRGSSSRGTFEDSESMLRADNRSTISASVLD